MALLEASNIKKIYTSEDNIAVGITDINLMFDKNEIVAITGESGSGKSTLLRVLGGLESYEEGELYFKGLPTSHYNQEDWAEYLNTNISFIFQEYNILESFTVLENVMFALTEIKSLKERKQRAIEILERVGLKDRIKAKGSQLSGGEKQRTVIARAIAKDSPIVLADEPTGNLDSNTAKDIIDLLKEISKDKLVIIVTHNYEDVEPIITRHIRLHDGKIEEDTCNITHESSIKANPFDFKEEHEVIFKKKDKKVGKGGRPKDGLILGARRFTSRPKQNILTTFLLIIAALLVFITCVAMIPSNAVNADLIVQPGRLIVAAKDGTTFTGKELDLMKQEYGAKDAILFDSSLGSNFYEGKVPEYDYEKPEGPIYKLGYDLNYKLDEGEQIKNQGEVVLKVPFTLKGKYKIGEDITINGKYKPNVSSVQGGNMGGYYGGPENNNSNVVEYKAKVVGLTYYIGAKLVYVDMHKKDAQILSIKLRKEPEISVLIKDKAHEYNGNVIINAKVVVSQTAEKGKSKLLYTEYFENSNKLEPLKVAYGTYNDENRLMKADGVNINIKTIRKMPDTMLMNGNGNAKPILYVTKDEYDSIFLPRLVKESDSRQVSLYFKSYEEAKAASQAITGNGDKYITFLAHDYNPPKTKLGTSIIVALLVAGVISMVIVLSLVKIFSATKADVSIYRTMGISNSVIKGSTYVQVFFDMLPSLFITILAYFAVFFTGLGEKVNYMPIPMLILICIVVVAMGMLVAVGFNRVIYKEKINKGLRRTNK